MSEEYHVELIAYDTSNDPYRGYTVRASFLQEPHKRDALVEIFKNQQLIRRFLFPAYKVWNIAAHFNDIVDGELESNNQGYEKAAWDGIQGTTVFYPKEEGEG